MKISESAVALSANRNYSKYQETRVESATVRASVLAELQKSLEEESAEVSISEESQSLLDKLKEKNNQTQNDAQKKQLSHLLEQAKSEGVAVPEVNTETDHMIKTLRKILAMLKRMRSGKPMDNMRAMREVRELMEEDKNFGASVNRSGRGFSLSQQVKVLDLRTSQTAFSISNGGQGASLSAGATAWIRHTEKSAFVMEQESVSFSGTGIVKTADGREINFGVDLEMSRGFVGSFLEMSDEEVVLTDPLVINLDNATASLSDQKFFFDLDADGEKEEISSLGKGSGFLAFDKNGDGTINDGLELFGTKSGDGFADLATYDEDGNGWIDENDAIFSKLQIWSKDDDGKDVLLSLKQADVGAIYLGNADTQFHLNDTANKTHGVIQKTGVFLKESGGVGTVQHVDLAV